MNALDDPVREMGATSRLTTSTITCRISPAAAPIRSSTAATPLAPAEVLGGDGQTVLRTTDPQCQQLCLPPCVKLDRLTPGKPREHAVTTERMKTLGDMIDAS